MRLDPQFLEYMRGFFLPRRGNSTLGGNITPSDTDTYSLGSPSRRFDTIYTRVLVADNVSAQGGTADTVDGFHAYATPQPNALLALDASSVYPISVYPQALLVDGSRALTGNLSVNAGITIDGVDISVHAANATIHHLSGMSADDHTQYVHTTVQRTIQAVHSFAPTTTSAPFTLGANAQGQLVTGLNADKVDGIDIAGANAGRVARFATATSLTFGVIQDDGSTVAVGTTPVANLPLTLRSATNIGHIRMEYDATNTATLRATSGGNLFLTATGDIELDPVGNDVFPTSGYDLNLGTINKKFLTLHAAELWVETLVAQDTVATIGGRIIVAPTTTLTRDVAPADTAIYVKHNHLNAGDIVLLEADGKVEFILINSLPGGGGNNDYVYLVTRNLDGTGANQWYAGDAVVNTGSSGDGFIDLFSVSSVNGKPVDYIFNFDASASAYSTNYSDSSFWALFEVNGSIPAINDAIYFGFANQTWQNLYFYISVAGDYTVTFTWEYWNGSAWTSFSPTMTGNFLKTAGANEATWNKASLTGWAATTINGVSAYWVRYRLSSTAGGSEPVGLLLAITKSASGSWINSPYQGVRRVWSEKYAWGPTIVGNVRNSSTFNDWTEHWAIGNLNGLYGYGTDTYGVGLGKYGATAEYLTIDPTNGIRMYSGGVLRAQLDANAWTLGSTSEGEYVTISSTGISIYANATERIGLTGAGVLTIKDSTGAAVFTFNSSAGAEFTKPLTLGTSGGIYQGTGSFTTPTTGLKIWNDSGVGRVGGFNGGTLQWYANTDGKLYAAAGDIVIDANGITFLDAASTTNRLYWYYGSDSVGYITGDYAGGGSQDAVMWMLAAHNTGDPWTYAWISLLAKDYAGTSEARINIISDGTITMKGTVDLDNNYDFYTIPYTSYSTSSTVTGWSSFTTKLIYYKKIGKLVFVWYYILGTSNATTVSFTLPYTSANTMAVDFVTRAEDNGSWIVTIGELPANSSTVNFYVTSGGGAWTASGTKAIAGQFFYEAI